MATRKTRSRTIEKKAQAKAKSQKKSPIVPPKDVREKTKAARQIELALNQDVIARRAYEIWLEKGRPLGQDERNWLQAEADLQQATAR